MKIINYQNKEWVSLPDLFEDVKDSTSKMNIILKLKNIDTFFIGKTKLYEWNDESKKILNDIKK